MKTKKLFTYFVCGFLLLCSSLVSCKTETGTKDEVVETYVVTYSSKYGVVPASLAVTKDTKLKEENLPVLSETGRIFKGWFIDDVKIEPEYKVTSNITLVAVWDSESFKITYNANTKEEQNPVVDTFEYGTDITLKACSFNVPVGYYFNAWNTAADGTGTELKKGAAYKVTADLTLYATWWENSRHTITYVDIGDSDNSANPKDFVERLDYDNLQPLADTEYYTFGGWFFDKAYTIPVNAWTAGEWTTDLVVYAKWIPKTFTVSFNANGAEGAMESIVLTYNVNKTLPLNQFTKTGYLFAGWNTSADGKGTKVEDGVNYYATKDVVLYAQWTLVTYRIQYFLNGGDLAEENVRTYTVESEDIVLREPTMEGASFTGWFTDSDCSGTPISVIKKGSTGDLFLYAGYKVNEYTITFHKNATAATGTMEPITVKYNKNAKLPELAFVNIGYDFEKWNLKEDGSSEVSYADQGSIVTTNDIDLYAVWKLIECKIDYELNGGANNIANPLVYNYFMDTITLLPPVKEGYDFTGWTLIEDEEVTDIQISTINPKELVRQITLNANWAPSTDTPYTVNYWLQHLEDDNYTLDATENLTGTTEDNTAAVEKIYENYISQGVVQKTIEPDGSTVVDIYYDLPIVFFGFNGKGVSFDEKPVYWVSAKRGSVIGDVLPAEYKNPSRNGYIFGGWYNSETDELIDYDTVMLEKTEYYAKWSWTLQFVRLEQIDDISLRYEYNSDKTKMIFTLPDNYDSYKWSLDNEPLVTGTNTFEVDVTTLLHDGVYTLYVEVEINSIPRSAIVTFKVGN